MKSLRDVRNERICGKHRHNPTSLHLWHGQKAKSRLVPPHSLHPDRNFAIRFPVPRLGLAPLTGGFRTPKSA